MDLPRAGFARARNRIPRHVQPGLCSGPRHLPRLGTSPSRDPSYACADLASGVENYLRGISPAPVRGFLRISGAHTDKTRGIQELQLTASHGHYLAPYARLLRAVAALRDKDRATARTLL